MQLSQQILKYRKTAHLTQEQLAEELGVTAQSVSNWERGGSPDINMLPVIANFFGITIDELMGNDEKNVRDEKNAFWSELRFVEGEERIRKLTESRRKFPHDVFAMIHLLATVSELPRETQKTYLPQVETLCERILDECNDPDLRNEAVYYMCDLCKKEEREKWLSLLPKHRRFQQMRVRLLCLSEDGDAAASLLQSAVFRFFCLQDFCGTRILDQCGPEQKIEWERQTLRMLDAISEDGVLPDAWIGLYGYKSLVISAACFGCDRSQHAQRAQEGWIWFEKAMECFRKWFSFPENARLSTGLGGICVTRAFYTLFLPDGTRQLNAEPTAFAAIDPKMLLYFLTNSRWAWFDSARGDRRFADAVEWVRSLV